MATILPMATRKRYGLGGGTYTRAELAERGMYKRELYAHESVWAALEELARLTGETRPEAFATAVLETLARAKKKSA